MIVFIWILKYFFLVLRYLVGVGIYSAGLWLFFAGECVYMGLILEAFGSRFAERKKDVVYDSWVVYFRFGDDVEDTVYVLS